MRPNPLLSNRFGPPHSSRGVGYCKWCSEFGYFVRQISNELRVDVGREGPWECRRSHTFIKIAFFLHLGPDFDDPSPSGPFWKPFGWFFFPINHVSKKTIVFHVILFCFVSAPLHSYCLIACTTAPTSTKLQNKTTAKSTKLRPAIPQDLRLRPETRWRGGRRRVDYSIKPWMFLDFLWFTRNILWWHGDSNWDFSKGYWHAQVWIISFKRATNYLVLHGSNNLFDAKKNISI